MKRYIINIPFCTLAVLTLLVFAACKKMDDYKKFAEGGEVIYPSTFDSLKVISGNGRVMITGLLAGDPKVTKYRVFWNSGNDSLEAPFVRSGGIDTLKQIVSNLPEGPITFTVRTYDAKGNRSIPMIVTGNVYGQSFQTSVNQRGNRVVLKTSFSQDGAAIIHWANVDAYVGVLGMQLHYVDADNVPRDTIVHVQLVDQQTILPNAGIKNLITYNTLYLPEKVGIDTFTVSQKELPAFTEVTLLNSQKPVANAANDGSRWATLRDWITNPAAKNHNGYGGTDISGDPKIYFEAGWGGAAIQNGKIHQVVTLPPGKYKFEGSVDWYHRGSRNDTYLVAMAGPNGLPDVDNVNTAIASAKLENGWWSWDTTFELTQKTTLSLGLLLYMNDDGEATRLNSLRLYIVN
ncbi:DUF5013 domain-containing protein [Pseudoflavitalea sp. X16]|uniref:DUF4998 domain-containing protein n=1 Tax=Paraflavitalea devenefica TaxID=2716334 RepID=UPI00141F7646|nr:DUF4998 domain-containing protein [Paraflavitalea devenefica]NII27041.1 DUF5013 domain-containing protein [Paraflavitalea devenefica]